MNNTILGDWSRAYSIEKLYPLYILGIRFLKPKILLFALKNYCVFWKITWLVTNPLLICGATVTLNAYFSPNLYVFLKQTLEFMIRYYFFSKHQNTSLLPKPNLTSNSLLV